MLRDRIKMEVREADQARRYQIRAMTAPQPKRCQALGCGQPIPAERLRLYPSVVTCSEACHVAYRKDSISRAARDWRRAAGPKSMPEKRSEIRWARPASRIESV